MWLPTGATLAAFVLLGFRIWPGVLLGACLVNLSTAGSLATSIGIAVGNTLEGPFGAYVVKALTRGVKAFDRTQGVFKFAFFAGVISPTLSATVGVTSRRLVGLGYENEGLQRLFCMQISAQDRHRPADIAAS